MTIRYMFMCTVPGPPQPYTHAAAQPGILSPPVASLTNTRVATDKSASSCAPVGFHHSHGEPRDELRSRRAHAPTTRHSRGASPWLLGRLLAARALGARRARRRAALPKLARYQVLELCSGSSQTDQLGAWHPVRDDTPSSYRHGESGEIVAAVAAVHVEVGLHVRIGDVKLSVAYGTKSVQFSE